MEEVKACDYKNLPYAQSFVIYQQPGGDMFEPMEALKCGSIFTSLCMPYTFWRFKNGQK